MRQMIDAKLRLRYKDQKNTLSMEEFRKVVNRFYGNEVWTRYIRNMKSSNVESAPYQHWIYDRVWSRAPEGWSFWNEIYNLRNVAILSDSPFTYIKLNNL